MSPIQQAAAALVLSVAGFALGWILKPTDIRFVTTIVEKPVVVEKVVESACTPTVERVWVEREPTPRPTDCVVMRWLK